MEASLKAYTCMCKYLWQACVHCVDMPSLCDTAVSLCRGKNPPIISGLSPCLLYPPVPAPLPASFAFLFIESFQFLHRHYCLCAQPPRQREPPQHHHHHHHHCCVTEEQKRECQTPPTRSLSHQSPHLSSRWGCVFSGVSFNPKSPPKWKTPSPLRSPLLSCPSSTCSAATRPWPGHVPSLSHPSGESY